MTKWTCNVYMFLPWMYAQCTYIYTIYMYIYMYVYDECIGLIYLFILGILINNTWSPLKALLTKNKIVFSYCCIISLFDSMNMHTYLLFNTKCFPETYFQNFLSKEVRRHNEGRLYWRRDRHLWRDLGCKENESKGWGKSYTCSRI